MAEAKDTSKPPTGSAGNAAHGGPSADAGKPVTAVTFKNVWPIPVLVLATGMLVGGMTLAWISKRQKPDPAGPFNHAISLVEKQEFEDGLAALNDKAVLGFLDFGSPTPEQRAAYHLSMARALFGAQAAKGLRVKDNFRTIAQEYNEARKLGAVMEPADSVRLAESLLAMDEVDKALDIARTLPDAEGGAAKRTRLIKLIVEHNLAASNADAEGAERAKREAMTLDLLASLVGDPELSNADKAWVLARQSELLLAMGRPDEAIAKLIRRIGLLRDVPAEQQGELYVLLGRAYFETDQPTSAAKQLEIADGLIERGSQTRAELSVILGQIAQKQKQPDFERAKDRFSAVIAEFPNSKAMLRAELGLAEVEAALAKNDRNKVDQEALERYAALVESVKRGGPRGDVTREMVYASLMQRHQERFDSELKEQKESSLRFAILAETLFKDDQIPPDLLNAIGRTQRAIADDMMAQVRAGKPQDFGVDDLDPTTRAEVKQRYMLAGEYLRRHAMAVAATDPGAYAGSLWMAADSFDLAGDLDEAKKSFSQYADGASDNDPRKPEAKFRLAQVFQAKREYAAAAALYEQLAASRGAPGMNTVAGVWADRAIVPLARCLFEDGNPGNDAEAERLLMSVVEGSSMSPDAAGYRDALIQLGTMCYNAGKYPDAIGWLEQAAGRYQDDRRIDSVRYRLADSHRLEAQRIAKALEQKLPQSQTTELTEARAEHLRSAQALYQTVRESLEAKDKHELSALEKVYVRNAYFYAGDCAFDLKDYDAAIAAYDLARLRYTDDPSSLVAMAQIVSAYAAQGKWAQARTANERARQQLARFPDEVWSRPDLPMEKRHWERWLDARTQLEQAAQVGADKQ